MIERPVTGWKIKGVMTHPGVVLLEDFLKPLIMRADVLASHLRVEPAEVEAVVSERAPITPDLALRLARLFGTSAQLWLNLQTKP